MGKSQSINGIRYRPLDRRFTQDEDAILPFAYCGNPTTVTIPLKNEIVVITSLPSEDRMFNSLQTKSYWMSVVNIWNSPHHNAYPDTLQDGDGKCDLGEEFDEVDIVAPLQVFPGDTLISGRHGNTLRLGGTKHKYNKLTEEGDNGKPFIIINNKKLKNLSGPIKHIINTVFLLPFLMLLIFKNCLK